MNPDEKILKLAADFIQDAEKRHGYCRALLDISANDDLPPKVSLAAAV